MKRAETKIYEKKMAIRPRINAEISVTDFKEFYWWDCELTEFCRDHGLVSTDRKTAKEARIIRFLQGQATADDFRATAKKRSYTVLSSQSPQKKSCSESRDEEPTLDTIICEDFKFNQKSRDFFLKQIGDHFKFTAHIGAYVRSNYGKITYRDFIKEWESDLAHRKAGYKPPIMASCRYNQFIRDYLADNKGASFSDAVAAWKEVRDKRGDQKFHK